jgi:hypothetical protein
MNIKVIYSYKYYFNQLIIRVFLPAFFCLAIALILIRNYFYPRFSIIELFLLLNVVVANAIIAKRFFTLNIGEVAIVDGQIIIRRGGWGHWLKKSYHLDSVKIVKAQAWHSTKKIKIEFRNKKDNKLLGEIIEDYGADVEQLDKIYSILMIQNE